MESASSADLRCCTSKSGGTVETLVQTVATLDRLKDAGLSKLIPKLFLGITEPAMPGRSNALRDLLEAHKIPMLPHHTGIGGRFSVLSIVGLLPAMARGLDPLAVRAGAQSVLDAMSAVSEPKVFAPAIGAAVAVGLAKDHGVKVHVMMPYADRLGRFGDWFAQLWAESLGKSGQGTSPVACLGPLDQHSQLQLFMDGPREHLLTIIRLATAGEGPRIDPALARLAHEPPSALAAGPAGLDALATICAGAPLHLTTGGALIVEHGATQGADVRALMAGIGLAAIATHDDLAGRPRATRGNFPR